MEKVTLQQPDLRMMNDADRLLPLLKNIRDDLKRQAKPVNDTVSAVDQAIVVLEKFSNLMVNAAKFNQEYDELEKYCGELRQEKKELEERVNKLRPQALNLENERARQSVQGQGSRKSDAA